MAVLHKEQLRGRAVQEAVVQDQLLGTVKTLLLIPAEAEAEELILEAHKPLVVTVVRVW